MFESWHYAGWDVAKLFASVLDTFDRSWSFLSQRRLETTERGLSCHLNLTFYCKWETYQVLRMTVLDINNEIKEIWMYIEISFPKLFWTDKFDLKFHQLNHIFHQYWMDSFDTVLDLFVSRKIGKDRAWHFLSS